MIFSIKTFSFTQQDWHAVRTLALPVSHVSLVALVSLTCETSPPMAVQYLSDEEIKRFLDDLDHDGNGYIEYSDIEQKLDLVHDELALPPGPFHRTPKRIHDANSDHVRHSFLRSMMRSDAQRIPRDEFASIVRDWQVPSLDQSKSEELENTYFKRRPGWRRIRAYWAVHGPKLCFIAVFVAMELAFGIWQLVKYQTVPKYRAAFGWSVVMSKTCAGTLYPTFFFLILSMSRYLSTFLRRWYYVSRFFNWGLSQHFHIIVSCLGLLQATLHALGHLAGGTFRHGSNPANQDAVAAVIGADGVPKSYVDYVRSLPGWTGIVALGLFYTLSLLSIPQVRRWNYEVFQLGHLLMFPIIGLMIAHGLAALLQWPMFGYFLAFPTLLVFVERVVRVSLGFHRIKARLVVLDDDTVEITANIPGERFWKYRAGQYIFLQVPKISFFQWHPFTISFHRDNKMMVHIKTDGDWTGRLRKLVDGSGEIEIGVNGPFGAPAEHFYDFQRSIIIGAGIGVTPFSGILADMQHNDDCDHGGPGQEQTSKSNSQVSPEMNPVEKANPDSRADNGSQVLQPPNADEAVGPDQSSNKGIKTELGDGYRRVDFHWIVRDRNYLLWFSDLLNEVSASQLWHHTHEEHPHLDIRINTHVTMRRKSISTHIYRWLLEKHRTDDHPASPITGLLNPTHFGRPDMNQILDDHYEEMREFRASQRQQIKGSSDDYKEDNVLKVGVFYCGAPVVGEILADKCSELTARGRYDGSKIEYHFLIEVF